MALASRSARSPKPSRTMSTVRLMDEVIAVVSGSMVGLAAQDAERTVELFEDNNSGEAMWQRQPPERPHEVGPPDQPARQPVGAADDAGDALLAAVHRLLQRRGQLLRRELLAELGV